MLAVGSNFAVGEEGHRQRGDHIIIVLSHLGKKQSINMCAKYIINT